MRPSGSSACYAAAPSSRPHLVSLTSPNKAVQCVADFTRAFQKGKMPAVFDSDQLGAWYRASDPLSGPDHEIVIAGDDQGRDGQSGELGQEVIAWEVPCVAHEAIFD